MVNYNDGKIYKLVGGGKIYIGSTTQRLSKRKSQHKKNKMCSSKELVKCDDFDIILIEKYPCQSKEELHARERYYIEKMECVNKNIPGRTKKEYREASKDEIKKRNKAYREANKDKIKAYKKAYREANKEVIKKRNKAYVEANKDKIKAYREANKEKNIEYQKEYYKANKERIKTNK